MLQLCAMFQSTTNWTTLLVNKKIVVLIGMNKSIHYTSFVFTMAVTSHLHTHVLSMICVIAMFRIASERGL